jgi:hypothetical protein
MTVSFRTARTRREPQEIQCVIIPLEMILAILNRQYHTIPRLECAHLAPQTLECVIHIQILGDFHLQAFPHVAVVGIRPAEGMDAVVRMEVPTGLIPVAPLLDVVVLWAAEVLQYRWDVEGTDHHPQQAGMVLVHSQ